MRCDGWCNPDKTITIVATKEGVLIGSGGETAESSPEAAEHIFVRKLEMRLRYAGLFTGLCMLVSPRRDVR